MSEIAAKLWEQQGILFTQQREMIIYLSQFVPKEAMEHYTNKLNEINNTLNNCKVLDQLL